MKKIRRLKAAPKRQFLEKFYRMTKVQQQAVGRLTNGNFKPDLAVTLTFTECPFDSNVNTHNKQRTNDQYHFCDKQFRKLMCRLNKAYMGSRWTKENKQDVIQVFAVIEISKNNRYHYHLAFEVPTTKASLTRQKQTKEEFQDCITEHWNKFGYVYKPKDPSDKKQIKKAKPQIKFRDITDNGWIEYITKDLHKDSGLGYCEYSNFSY